MTSHDVPRDIRAWRDPAATPEPGFRTATPRCSSPCPVHFLAKQEYASAFKAKGSGFINKRNKLVFGVLFFFSVQN